MKYEWKKQDKVFYLPKNKPEAITIPSFNYFMLKGKGNPNNEAFSAAVSVLYSLSYAIKMLPKKGPAPEGYFDYTIFPLEGVWDLSEEGRKKSTLDKDELVYTVMIRQPDFVTASLAAEILERQKSLKPLPQMDKAIFDSAEDGLSVQMLHNGPYEAEPQSFAVMEQYCQENGLLRMSHTHREIYLSDARRSQPDKLRTVLRFPVSLVD